MTAETERFYQLLVAGIGFDRRRDPRLEYQAQLRAREARDEVGLYGSSGIPHPPQDERERRLGTEWAGAAVAEVAAWLYQWQDPIPALVDDVNSYGSRVGLLNTEPHRTILTDPRYKHWGAWVYTELPPGETDELQRRYYGIVWLSVEAPIVKAIVVNGEAYADAVVAGPLAARNGASVFLVGKDAVPAATRVALTELKPNEIVVVGSSGVVSDKVSTELAKIAPVRRVAGANRYETAVAVSKA